LADADRRFLGDIDEVRIWDAVRPIGEIVRDMKTCASGALSGLSGYWPLDEGSGQVAGDVSGNGNDMTLSATSILTLKPHATVSYPDIASQLKLPRGASGQLSWSANQPIAVAARDRVNGRSFSGFEPVRRLSDGGSRVMVPYVEDSKAFSTALELNNLGPITANVTVGFADGSTGEVFHRDLQVAVNSVEMRPMMRRNRGPAVAGVWP
jgi:hypothetical protein